MNDKESERILERSPRKRRARYTGRYPRRYEEKYKEHQPEKYAETVGKVLAGGKTPAGTHRPIMVNEILGVLEPRPGEVAVDCTLGYGGHARAVLERLTPGGRLIGLDTDPIELEKTTARMIAACPEETFFSSHRTNFAGILNVLESMRIPSVDMILADLGVSSMQLDDPSRGFSFKVEGPLDMRMNRQKGYPASLLLRKLSRDQMERILVENADEPNARVISEALAGKEINTTKELASAVRLALSKTSSDNRELSVRRVFQALRIEVNDEFSALEALLRTAPSALGGGGRIAVLTFHSGEDRRVKRAFEEGLRSGQYSQIATEVIRASPEERRMNPRSAAAKLRWGRRA